jgi:hypothetical protein
MRKAARRPLPPFRVYLCESSEKIAQVRGIEARSAEQARKMAAQVLNTQDAYSIAEVWHHAQFVCTVRKDPDAQG